MVLVCLLQFAMGKIRVCWCRGDVDVLHNLKPRAHNLLQVNKVMWFTGELSYKWAAYIPLGSVHRPCQNTISMARFCTRMLSIPHIVVSRYMLEQHTVTGFAISVQLARSSGIFGMRTPFSLSSHYIWDTWNASCTACQFCWVQFSWLCPCCLHFPQMCWYQHVPGVLWQPPMQLNHQQISVKHSFEPCSSPSVDCPPLLLWTLSGRRNAEYRKVNWSRSVSKTDCPPQTIALTALSNAISL